LSLVFLFAYQSLLAEKQNQIQNLLQYSQKKKLKLQKKVSSQKNQINELKVKTYQIRENEIEPLKNILKNKKHFAS
jgi:F0F1-type ATP synthase membrane subunit b/b'